MQKLQGINIAIASGSETAQECLRAGFQARGGHVVCCDYLTIGFVNRLKQSQRLSEDGADETVHVILIDMDDSYEEDDNALDRLIEAVDLPLLFHDNNFDDVNDGSDGCGFSEQALDKLAYKLAELVQSYPKTNAAEATIAEKPTAEAATSAVSDAISAVVTDSVKAEPVAEQSDEADELVLIEDALLKGATAEKRHSELTEQKVSEQETFKQQEDRQIEGREAVQDEQAESIAVKQHTESNVDIDETIRFDSLDFIRSTQLEDTAAVNVWVLGSSIGGPEALKRFFSVLSPRLPVAFVIAQHLGEGFVSLLARQLDSCGEFQVKEALNGDRLKHGEAIIVPVENRMTLGADSQIEFIEGEWTGHYKPSIDCVIQDVTDNFKNHSGVIIFSGMGADGVLASQQFVEKHQGHVWAQDSESCVISSMPDSVRKANLVSFSGSPEELAYKVMMHFSSTSAAASPG